MQKNKILLPLDAGCIEGRFIRRVKRFSVEFEYNGRRLWAHSNNSGTMLGLLRPGMPVLLSPAANQERKLKYTLELVKPAGEWIGVNTLTPNRLLKKAFAAGLLSWAAGYTEFRAEAKYGQSRLDAIMTAPGRPPLWVECKNVTMMEDEAAAFPDAVSLRAQKHLGEMTEIVRGGGRAAFFYCVQRTDGRCFGPADYVDPAYAELFYQSLEVGVEAYAHVCAAGPGGINLGRLLPLRSRNCLDQGILGD